MNQLTYGYEKQLPNATFDEALERVTKALADEGFGVLTEIDVKATLKKKLDVDFPRYMILGACNPKLAHKALQAESPIGLLLPCNVIVTELEDGDVRVAAADPGAMFQMVDNPDLKPLAGDVTERIRRVIEAV